MERKFNAPGRHLDGHIPLGEQRGNKSVLRSAQSGCGHRPHTHSGTHADPSTDAAPNSQAECHDPPNSEADLDARNIHTCPGVDGHTRGLADTIRDDGDRPERLAVGDWVPVVAAA